jgi:phenylpropionate dioxygenase-like ring-hydroxylating dioxygenase large terminal subunit
MKGEAMQERAKQIVVDYFNQHVDATDRKKITKDDVFVVWFCKTLQNWKALVSTNVSDGMHYEITHNGDKGETYLDAYKKWENKCIPDQEVEA